MGKRFPWFSVKGEHLKYSRRGRNHFQGGRHEAEGNEFLHLKYRRAGLSTANGGGNVSRVTTHDDDPWETFFWAPSEGKAA